MSALNSLIIGLGNAGGGLHLPCLRKLHGRSGLIAAVDPVAVAPDIPEARGLRVFRHLADVEDFRPDDTVVHVCTSPESHPQVIRSAGEMGYTRVLSEKPLAASVAGVEEIRRVRAGHNIEILVVANWLHSRLTARLVTLIETQLFGSLRTVTVEQHKPRFARTLANPSHGTAFDVEIPHQVALALRLAGRPLAVTRASSGPMRIGGQVFTHMGAAGMVLRHAGEVTSVLRSDLCACRRERFVRVEFDDGHQALGFYPVDREENFSRLDIYDWQGRLVSRDTFEDDVLTACFAECYGYFSGAASRPVSDVEFHADVTSVIDQAKLLCGATAH